MLSRAFAIPTRLALGAQILLLLTSVSSAQTPYTHGEPTADEQYVLELINRARANPAAEGERLTPSAEDTARLHAAADVLREVTLTAALAPFLTIPASRHLAS